MSKLAETTEISMPTTLEGGGGRNIRRSRNALTALGIWIEGTEEWGRDELHSLPLRLGQSIRDSGIYRGMDFKSHVTGFYLDIFRNRGVDLKAASPRHNTNGASVDGRCRDRRRLPRYFHATGIVSWPSAQDLVRLRGIRRARSSSEQGTQGNDTAHCLRPLGRQHSTRCLFWSQSTPPAINCRTWDHLRHPD